MLGATGMLGSMLVRELSSDPRLSVSGTVRSTQGLPDQFVEELGQHLVEGVDVLNSVARGSAILGADVVVNAVGVIKQASGLEDRAATVALNALLPQQLAAECAEAGARLIHVSTDCVFSGRRGRYTEDQTPDPVDFYGRSKLLGEVFAPALTLRTSIIGHEVQRHASLIDWFLTQPQTQVNGYARAIYSGVTTYEFARVLRDVVLPRPGLQGLFHLASEPISKLDLLTLVAKQYGWAGAINRDEAFECDRSMRADALLASTGYAPPSWPQMVADMHASRPPWSVGLEASSAS